MTKYSIWDSFDELVMEVPLVNTYAKKLANSNDGYITEGGFTGPIVFDSAEQ